MNDPGGSARSTLVLLGDTRHYRDEFGRLCTHGALAGQLDLWARRFDRVVFCGVEGEGPPPASFVPYASANIEMVPLRAAGGTGVRAKIDLLVVALSWIRAVVPVLRRADAVHLRTPCNVTLVGIPLARLLVAKRYAIFAGSWSRYPGEPVSYRLQRWMLLHLFGGVVHAYVPEGATSPLRPAFSPVLTIDGLAEVGRLREGRPDEGRPGVQRPLRIVSVGRFSTNKNQIALVEAVRRLSDDGPHAEAVFIGDGPTRPLVQQAASGLESVSFIPVASRPEVFAAMASADVNVLASFREGYPKVLLEGICAGALPIAADRRVNRSMTQGRGWVFDPSDPSDLARVLRSAVELDDDGWEARRSSCQEYARSHSLEAFGAEVDHIVYQIWGFPGRSEAPCDDSS